MGIAALVLGIIGLIISLVPACNVIMFVPCLVGLGLGIADIAVKSKRGQPKAMGIVGTVLNGVALLIIVIWCLFLGFLIVSDPTILDDLQNSIEEVSENQGEVAVEAGKVQVNIAVPAPPQTPQTPQK